MTTIAIPTIDLVTAVFTRPLPKLDIERYRQLALDKTRAIVRTAVETSHRPAVRTGRIESITCTLFAVTGITLHALGA